MATLMLVLDIILLLFGIFAVSAIILALFYAASAIVRKVFFFIYDKLSQNKNNRLKN